MHYYFDMDGVLAVYAPEDPPGSTPWLDPNARFYATRQPDHAAIALATRLSHTHGARVSIVTRVHEDESLLRTWIDEKLMWLDTHAPRLDRSGFVVIPSTEHDKSAVLDGVPVEERREHCLVDDDPAILDRWVAAGGSAIQYSRSTTPHDPWDGTHVHGEMDLTTMMRKVQEIELTKHVVPDLSRARPPRPEA